MQHSQTHLQQHALHVVDGGVLKVQQLQRAPHRVARFDVRRLARADAAQLLQGGEGA
jgi:hypothetical protein